MTTVAPVSSDHDRLQIQLAAVDAFIVAYKNLVAINDPDCYQIIEKSTNAFRVALRRYATIHREQTRMKK